MSGMFGGSKSSSQIKDTTPNEFKDLRPDVKRVFEGLLAGGKTGDLLSGIPEYGGQLAAPITAAEQQALAGLQQQTGPGTARNQLLDQTMGGQFLSQGNPFLQDAIAAAQRQTQEAYEQSVGRVLPGQFAQAGHRTQPGQSSPFDTAAALQSRGFANALGDIASNMQFGAYEAERGRQQQAIQLSQQEVATGIENLKAQGLPRMITQHGLDKGLELFQQKTASLLQLLQTLSGGMLNQQQVLSESKTSPDVISPFLGLGGTAAMAGGMMVGGGSTPPKTTGGTG